MLQQLGADAYRAGGEHRFEEEDREAAADHQHRGDEQKRDRRSELGPGQARCEQQGDQEAGEHGRKHRQEDRPTDQAHAPVEHPQFADPPVVLGAAAFEQPRLDCARAVDDAREARGADVEECADTAQQEHRRNGEPHDFGDGDDGQVGRGLDHACSMHGCRRLIQIDPRQPVRCLGGALFRAARNLEQQQSVHREACGEHPGEGRDEFGGRPKNADHQRRDGKARDQQHGEQEIHACGNAGPDPDRSRRFAAGDREDDAAHQQPADHRRNHWKKVGLRIQQEQKPGERGDCHLPSSPTTLPRAAGNRRRPRSARWRPAVRRSYRTRCSCPREAARAGGEDDDGDARDADSPRAGAVRHSCSISGRHSTLILPWREPRAAPVGSIGETFTT